MASLLTDVGGRPSGDRARNLQSVATLLRDPATVEQLLDGCDAAAQAMFDHLDRSGSAGASDTARVDATVHTAVTPVEQLLARGLLLPTDRRHVTVPREVAMARRGGRTTHEQVGEPPALASTERAQRLVDQAAAGAAYELVHRTDPDDDWCRRLSRASSTGR